MLRGMEDFWREWRGWVGCVHGGSSVGMWTKEALKTDATQKEIWYLSIVDVTWISRSVHSDIGIRLESQF